MKLSAAALLSATIIFAQNGEALFDAKCNGCHIKTRPTQEMKRTLAAPPAMGVMFHVKQAYESKEEAIAFIKDYALNPDVAKAECLPQSIKRFGVMPSQKGLVSDDELSKIAEYLYENFPTKAFAH